MKILLKLKLLLILSVCLVIAVVIELRSASVSGDSLPGLVEILKDDIKRIELTHQGNKVVLNKWRVIGFRLHHSTELQIGLVSNL